MTDYPRKFESSESNTLESNQTASSGCTDVVVIEQDDGTFMCTQFYVRFAKLEGLKSRETLVSITVNGQETNFKMKLGAAGDGFFQKDGAKGKPDKDDDDTEMFSCTNRRTLRPNSEMLKTFNLKPGANVLTYTVQSSTQGEEALTADIYLWLANSKIVISDIDGTTTKSHVLGQLMPAMGGERPQPGVASLYSSIRRNGYQILYLTTGDVGQSQRTKDFLNSLKQEGCSLPPGPVLSSPDRLVQSSKGRRPEVSKIACLRDLRSLFPPTHNPLYAGFGNKDTDAIAYQAVGVYSGKIFTTDTVGEVNLLNATYSKSYLLMNDMVDEMFPGIQMDDKYQVSEEYNFVNYFKINYDLLIDFDVSELL